MFKYQKFENNKTKRSTFYLGCLYANGVGVEQDLTKARGLTAKAAAQKDMMVPFYALQLLKKKKK